MIDSKFDEWFDRNYKDFIGDPNYSIYREFAYEGYINGYFHDKVKEVKTLEQNAWIRWKWTEEKPYPETLDDTKIDVMFMDNDVITRTSVGFWYGNGDPESSNWHPSNEDSYIKFYRLSK